MFSMDVPKIDKNEKKPSKLKKKFIIIFLLILCAIIIGIIAFFSANLKFTLNGDKSMTVEVGSEFVDPGATATFRGKNLDDKIMVTGNPDIKHVGNYSITYRVKLLFKTFSLRRQVSIVDTLDPEIILTGGNSISWVLNKTFKDPGYEAKDNYDGDISKLVKVTGDVDISKPGKYKLTYSVSDKSGNKVNAIRTVNVCTKEEASGSVIYLTFDDGPSAAVTSQDLDILKKNGIHATFYIVNYSETLLPVIKRELAEGHTIGIHGFSHDYSKIYVSPEIALDNLLKLREKLLKDTGYEAYTFRFPGGSSNTVSRKYCPGVMTKVTKMLEERTGYSYMDWNVSSGDATAKPLNADTIAQNVISGLKHGRGNVVLMHDSGAKSSTSAALQRIIDYGNANGYTFAPIPVGLTPVHHPINN